MTLLVGREAELGELEALLAHGRNAATLAMLRGEPGIGKSVLLERACQSLPDDVVVLRSVGVESETHLSFAALHHLLRPVLAHSRDLPARLRAALLIALGIDEGTLPDTHIVGLATLELLSGLADRQPVVLVVDDIQWLDAPTADVLHFVARRLELETVTVLLVIRDGQTSPLLELGLPELAVTSLDGRAAEQLLDAVRPDLDAALRSSILATAAGNPLAIIELPGATPRGVSDPAGIVALTARLERAFSSRLMALPEMARTLMLIAAANDSDLAAEVVAAGDVVFTHAEDVTSQLDRILSEGLLELDHGSLTFRHPLVRSAAYLGASLTERRTAHAALADVLSDQPERRAHHLGLATIRSSEKVATDMEAAARLALARGAVATGIDLIERAAELTPGAGARNRRLLEAGELALRLGDQPRTLVLTARVNAAALDHAQQSRLRLLRETVDASGDANYGRVDTLVGYAEERASAGDVDLAFGFLLLAASKLWVTDQGRDARIAVLDAAQRITDDPYDPRLLAIIGFTDPEEHGLELRERSARLEPRLLDAESALLLGSAINLAGAFDLSAPLLARAVEGFREQGRLGRLPEALCHQTWTALHQLNWSVAVPAVDEATQLSLETGQPIWRVSAQIAEGLLVGLRGDSSRGNALCDEAESVAAPLGARAMLSGIQITRGIVALGEARYAEAFLHLFRMFDPGDSVYHHYQSFWAIGDLAEAAVHTGRVDEVQDIYRALEPAATSSAATWLHVGLAYARPLLAEESEAEELFRSSLGSVLSGWPLYRARMHLEYGRWLRRRRRVTESRDPLRVAAGMFDRLGVRSFGSLARRELRAAGEASRDPVAEPWAALSPQELHIARLAADGLSNKEIAERLFLSHRTVASHLYRIFPKLGVTSRGQLSSCLSTL